MQTGSYLEFVVRLAIDRTCGIDNKRKTSHWQVTGRRKERNRLFRRRHVPVRIGLHPISTGWPKSETMKDMVGVGQ